MSDPARRLAMAIVGVALLLGYGAAAVLGVLVLATLLANPPEPWLVAVGLLVTVVVGGALSYRFGTARLLTGIDAVELSRSTAPALHRRVDRLAASMAVDRPPLLVADLGAPNALSIGGPRGGAIVLDRRLLPLLTLEELEGIVAHELAHVERKDALVKTVVFSGMRTTAGVLFLLFLPATLLLVGTARAAAWIAGQPARAPDVEAAATAGIQLLVAVLLSVLTLLALAHARRQEFAADRRAAAVTGRPAALARALTKIHRAAEPTRGLRSLLTIHGEESRGIRRLLSTHPPLAERLERLGGTARPDPTWPDSPRPDRSRRAG
jgi:heat shock protein HtpX